MRAFAVLIWAPLVASLRPHIHDSVALRNARYDSIPLRNSVLLAPERRRTNVAVLNLPGLGRYFSSFELCERFEGVGMDLCGLDYRRYGRQYLREGGEAAGPENAFNFIRDLRDYWDDVDEALVHLCEERKYEKIILMGDSTGGLTATSYLLFAGDRPGHSLVKMCILNSPLLKFNAARLNRLARGVVRIVGAVAPQLVLVRDDANPKKIVTRRKGPLRMRKEVLRVEPEDYWFDQVCALHGHKYDPILQSPSEGKKPVYSGYVRACLSMMRRIVSAHKKEGKTIPIPAVLFTPNTDVYLERLASKSSPGGQATVPPFTEAMDQSVQLAERPDKTLHVDPHIDVRGVEALFDTLFPNGKRRAFERANHEVLMSEWNVIDSVMELIRDTAEDAGIV